MTTAMMTDTGEFPNWPSLKMLRPKTLKAAWDVEMPVRRAHKARHSAPARTWAQDLKMAAVSLYVLATYTATAWLTTMLFRQYVGSEGHYLLRVCVTMFGIGGAMHVISYYLLKAPGEEHGDSDIDW